MSNTCRKTHEIASETDNIFRDLPGKK